MKSRFLLIGLILLIALILAAGYYSFSVNDQLKNAVQAIEAIHGELEVARDSLNSAQSTVRQLAERLHQSEVQLHLIRSQVEAIDLNYKKDRAENWKKLQELKRQLKEKEAAIALLREEAAKFRY